MRIDIWQQLLEVSRGLTVPAHIRGAIQTDHLKEYLSHFRDILREFLPRRNAHQGIKLFVDGAQNNRVLAAVMEQPPRPAESLDLWTKQLFNDSKFGLILNNLELYSPALTQTVAQGVAPLLESAGLPLGGLALLFFMGNYGFTPFGVHKDNRGEEGFLFHIGPGIKTFYIWETDRYLELTGGREIYPYPEQIIGDATSYRLMPGDLMYFPSETYHIADTPEFSVSMVLDFNNPSILHFKRLMAERMTESLAERTLAPSQLPHLSLFPQRFTCDDVQRLAASLAVEEELQRTLEEHLLRLQSNGGFYNPAPFNSIMKPTTPETLLRALPPFKILCMPPEISPANSSKKNEEMIDLYARGHRIRLNFHPALPELIDAINSDRGIRRKELQERLLPDWSVADVIMLISRLQNVDAIRVA